MPGLLSLLTMRILIIGAAGMLGRKLSERLLRDGSLGGETIETLRSVGYALRAA